MSLLYRWAKLSSAKASETEEFKRNLPEIRCTSIQNANILSELARMPACINHDISFQSTHESFPFQCMLK